MPVGPEDIKVSDWSETPLWEMKFKVWHALIEKGCIAKRGVGGQFCGLGGTACYYAACPRRIFEEVAVFKEDIHQPVPTPNFVKNFNQGLARIDKLEKGLVRTKKIIDQHLAKKEE